MMKLCQDPLAMAEIGRFNSLIVLRSTPQGLYLDGGEHGDILLPKRYVPADLESWHCHGGVRDAGFGGSPGGDYRNAHRHGR